MAKKDMAKINGDEQIDFEFNLSDKQYFAYSVDANEIFFGGSKGSGKSHLIRYASILYSLAIPGLQTYLFRRTSKQVRSNHLYGSTGYMNVLKPFIDAGKVDLNQSDNRIDFFHKDEKGKSLPTSSIFLRHCQHESDVEVFR